MKRRLLPALLLIAATTLSAGAAEFPSTVVLKLAQSAGGSWDIIGRVLASHLGQFLPGNPTIEVENVDGGKGMQLARQLVEAEPGDGSVFGSMPISIMQSSVLEPTSFDFPIARLQWIGGLAKTVAYCVRKKGTDAELSDDGVLVGATNRLGNFYANASLLKHLVNPGIQIVLGFKNEPELMAALDRGEIDIYCGTTRSTFDREDRKSVQDILGGVGRGEGLAASGARDVFESVPDGLDRRAVDLAITSSTMFYTFTLPASADPEVLATYREAFTRLTQDPAFQAEMKARITEFAPSTGEEVQAFVGELLASEPDVVARAIELLN